MNILGLDPANRCGYSHSHGDFGVWDLSAKRDKHPGRRLERFRRLLYGVRRTHHIDAIGFEDASFGSNNLHTAAMHNELVGLIKLAGAEWEVPVIGFKPNHLKKWATGCGRATKEQMIEHVWKRFRIRTSDDNVADAIIVMERTKVFFEEGMAHGQKAS